MVMQTIWRMTQRWSLRYWTARLPRTHHVHYQDQKKCGFRGRAVALSGNRMEKGPTSKGRLADQFPRLVALCQATRPFAAGPAE